MITKRLKIINIAGARPNFMKIAALYKIYAKHKGTIDPILVHTGQHSDPNMSQVFFTSLGIPQPDHHLHSTNGNPAVLIAEIMQKLEPIFKKECPDFVLVVGDVNSTLAAALLANKMGIRVIHVEAGLRSGDRSMPEEINRIVTDHLSDLLFVSEQNGVANLEKEGIMAERIFFVGNVMIDTLIEMMPKIDASLVDRDLGLSKNEYAVVTMHRPSNVDSPENLERVIDVLKTVIEQNKTSIVFPLHPRTRQSMEKHGLLKKLSSIKGAILTEPLEYTAFMKLVKNSAFVLTDSGGIQEEAAYLKIPTITMRTTTERPSTIDCGANKLLVDPTQEKLIEALKWVSRLDRDSIQPIELSDGLASQRIVDILERLAKEHI